MNRMSDSNSETTFETVNNMMVLLESSLMDVQLMISQAVESLFQIMEVEEVDIYHQVSLLLGGETVTVTLEELFYSEEDDLLMLNCDEGRKIEWHELTIPDQFEVVSQVHQKYVAEYKLSQLNRQEEVH